MLPLLLTESSQIFSLWNKRETTTGDSNDCSGGNLPQSKKKLKCPQCQCREWAISVLKGDPTPRHLTNQVWSRLQDHGILSGMQRGLFKVSRYSYGDRVIGPCLHIKHRSVLTSRRNTALDVLGWNSMLDRVKTTHCTAHTHKKRKALSMQTDTTAATPRCTNYSQAFSRLFTLTCKLCLLSRESQDIHQKWLWWDVLMWDTHACWGRGRVKRKFFERKLWVYSKLLRTEGKESRQGSLKKMIWVLTVRCHMSYGPRPDSMINVCLRIFF